MTAEGPLRDLAAAPEETLAAVLGTWQVEGEGGALSGVLPAEKGSASNAHRVARVIRGLAPSIEQENQYRAAQLQQQLQLQVQQSQQQRPLVRPGTTPGPANVRLDQVVDQALSAEVAPLTDEQVQERFQEHKRTYGAMPSPDDEPSTMQLTGAHHLLGSGVPPRVGFSIFGPRQLRAKKRLKFTALLPWRSGRRATGSSARAWSC